MAVRRCLSFGARNPLWIICKNSPIELCEIHPFTADCRLVHNLILVTPKNMEEAGQVPLPPSDHDFDGPQKAAGSQQQHQPFGGQ